MRLVSYLRVSTTGQLDGYGLDVQRQQHPGSGPSANGHKVIAEYSDVVTGKADVGERPGLLEAVQMVRRPPEAEGIVVGKLDRLARQLTTQEAILSLVWREGGWSSPPRTARSCATVPTTRCAPRHSPGPGCLRRAGPQDRRQAPPRRTPSQGRSRAPRRRPVPLRPARRRQGPRPRRRTQRGRAARRQAHRRAARGRRLLPRHRSQPGRRGPPATPSRQLVGRDGPQHRPAGRGLTSRARGFRRGEPRREQARSAGSSGGSAAGVRPCRSRPSARVSQPTAVAWLSASSIRCRSAETSFRRSAPRVVPASGVWRWRSRPTW